MTTSAHDLATLGAAPIDVWRISLAVGAAHLADYWAILSPSERECTERLRAADQRRRRLAAQGALRWVLARYLDVSPKALRFAHGDHGKPRLADTAPDQGLVFNLTHSGDEALLAVGRDLALGIDLELRRPLGRLDAMAERCLAPCELLYWRALPRAERLPAFFDSWTAKEAFAKATGRGLSLGLTRCVLAPCPEPRLASIPEQHGAAGEWGLWRLDLGAQFSATLCARTQAAQIRMVRFAPRPPPLHPSGDPFP
ncbi:4'-phosphopantetheinyl transferase family protein [Candidatus Methylocalor cossyra]|uniref:4'-phosphopantetheinyl transferase n=1 Tax=Candidatus Methylocalor cossyra TaxID=3108543 RepID=A0ABP1C5A8_9GAMM